MLFNLHPAVVFAIVTFSSIAIFTAVWCLLNLYYARACRRWPYLNRVVEKARIKGELPIIRKYGLLGLVVLMAVPFPTIGVYGGTLLSWLMGIKWWNALIAIVLGGTISNSIVLLSVYGLVQAVT